MIIGKNKVEAKEAKIGGVRVRSISVYVWSDLFFGPHPKANDGSIHQFSCQSNLVIRSVSG